MIKKIESHFFLAIILMLAMVLLSSCGNSYTESDIEKAEQIAYSKGYEDGYRHGAEKQWETDCKDFLIDGLSIRDIEEEVYKEYGITPREAFIIFDAYEYDSSHGGYTWDEYQNAIEAIYYTACIFPQE